MFIKDSFFDYIALQQQDRDITRWAEIYNILFKKIKNKNIIYLGTFLYVLSDINNNIVTGITHNPHKLLHEYLSDYGVRAKTKKLWPFNNLEYSNHILKNIHNIDDSFSYSTDYKYTDAIFHINISNSNDIIELYDYVINTSFNDIITTADTNSLIKDQRILSTYNSIDYDILYGMNN